MINRPSVQYAKGCNGWVAYEVMGDGPANVVLLPGPLSHLDLIWEDPSYALFLRYLAQFCKLVVFDRSGTGLSDPVNERLLTPQQTLDDFRAVMDASGMARAAIFGISGGGSLASLFAATAPDRTSSLVLYGAYARLSSSPDYPWGLNGGQSASEADREPDYRSYTRQNPTVVDDQRVGDWTERFFRSAGSPGVIRDVIQMMRQLDVRPILASVTAPTLVIARRDDRTISVDNSRYLASHIPKATLVELDGVDHHPWFGNARAVVDTIEGFLVGDRHKPRDRTAVLTRREREVVELITANLTAREVGRRLLISERTVETHIAHAYTKLGINCRIDLSRHTVEFDSVTS